MRGHLQCRDTLVGNQGCPLKTGTTVVISKHGGKIVDITLKTMVNISLKYYTEVI